jgi:hypothetical protein
MLIAETIDRFVKDSAVRTALGQRGHSRYQATFSNDKLAHTFLQALAKLQ